MPQSSNDRVLSQTLLGGCNYSCLQIKLRVMKQADLAGQSGDFKVLDAFKSTVTPLGLSYSSTGRVKALAIASTDKCLIVEFLGIVSTATRKKLEEAVLCKPEGEKYAFDMGDVSMSLLVDFNLHITDAVDIQSAFSEALNNSRHPIDSIRECLGTDVTVQVHEKNIARVFEHSNYGLKTHEMDLAQRAWIACLLPSIDTTIGAFAKVKRINTNSQTNSAINVLAKVVGDTLRLDKMKPTEVSHSFTTVASGSGQVEARASSYKSKFTNDQNIRIGVQTEHGPIVISGQTSRVHGRSVQIQTSGDHVLENKIVASVASQGRQQSTRAEMEKSAVILSAAQEGTDKLMENPWFRNIWCPPEDSAPLSWPEEWSMKNKKSRKPKISSVIVLNASQRKAVQTMVSADSDFLTIIQGPPGTGKTSVIASFVQSAVEAGRNGIWLVAETNVAVKNIAEKLASVNFTAWRLLVSKDFHFDWHEHIYSKVQDNIIRSEEFSKLQSRRLDGCQVLLCTLSMLSNKFIGRFNSRVPLKTMVVDEASQIQIDNFLACFTKFQSTLRKICFVGDDKQLPPYGQENVKGLRSIFEVGHLRKYIVFLDTQYRMPPQLGAFISTAVYGNQLKSNPEHPVPDNIVACQFFDVPGKEQTMGKSYKNELECETVVQIARILQDQNLSYKIITPYESQQSYIEDCMKKTPDLAWEDKCYVVDSFQGNEDDYIIVSLVRSRKQGFLENLRRTNVMLTRCKRGMYIVSGRKFLQGVGASCLAGRLLVHYGEKGWTTLEGLKKEFHGGG